MTGEPSSAQLPASAAPRLSRGKRLMFALVMVLVLYGVGELVWHLYTQRRLAKFLAKQADANSFYQPDPHMRTRLRPGDWINVNTASTDTCRFHVNSYGLRGPEISQTAPEGVLRVLCLGGSTTFGTSCLSDSTTYPQQLEQRLRARGLQVEVLNAGVPRYMSVDSWFNLQRLAGLEPDLIIVLHAINDITFSEELGPFYFEPESANRPANRELRYTLDTQSSMLTALWRRITAPDKNRIDVERQSIDPRTIEGFRKNLERIATQSRALNARLVLLTFETMLRSDNPSERKQAIENDELFQVCRLPYDTLCDQLAHFNTAIRETGAALSVPVLELEGAVEPDPEWWGDPFHLNERGTSRMVDAIVDGIAEQLEP